MRVAFKGRIKKIEDISLESGDDCLKLLIDSESVTTEEKNALIALKNTQINHQKELFFVVLDHHEDQRH